MQRREFLVSTGAAGFALGALPAAGVTQHPAVSAPEVGGAAHAAAGNTAAIFPTEPADLMNPSYIDARLDSRSVSFENPTGARGAGGRVSHGRKGRPAQILAPGEKIVLADLAGPGTLRHIWMALDPWPPEVMRAVRFEVFYDGLSAPSICVPILDFFGLPHGRRVEYYCAVTSVNEGRGCNSYLPMPFSHSLRAELTNESARHIALYYQIDYTVSSSIAHDPSYLHVTFRRENPTVLRRDFVITDGLRGPGRFLGCAIGIRVIEQGQWYGEGEVKIYRDGDLEFPTYCGTGLEDYVGSAWGLGTHHGPYAGAPVVRSNLIGFYRWHLPDPVMFAQDLRVTIQQIGSAAFLQGQEALYEAFKKNHAPAGSGWVDQLSSSLIGFGLFERRDDYCATAFVYCRHAQPVARFETEVAIRDVGLLPDEAKPSPDLSDDERERINAKVKELLQRQSSTG